MKYRIHIYVIAVIIPKPIACSKENSIFRIIDQTTKPVNRIQNLITKNVLSRF